MPQDKDFTPSGVKLEGQWENDRNAAASPCFKAMIREAYGVQDVIIGHHLIYETRDKRADGYVYEVVEEIPSADTLLFDHDVAKKIWGLSRYLDVLKILATTPQTQRDGMAAKLYAARAQIKGS